MVFLAGAQCLDGNGPKAWPYFILMSTLGYFMGQIFLKVPFHSNYSDDSSEGKDIISLKYPSIYTVVYFIIQSETF